MSRLHWYIARHYLGAGSGLLSLITWIALGGVTVGVTALVIVTAVMAGMQKDLRGKILESSPHIVVLEQSASLRVSDWEAVRDTILAVDGVVAAAPFALTTLAISKGHFEYSQSANLFGISIDTTMAPATEMERSIVEGVLDLERPKSGLPPVLLGIGLADRMALFSGDTVTLTAMENLKPDMFGNPVPTVRFFEVTGTFSTGMYDYDMENVYTTLGDAQELLHLDETNEVSGIGVRTVDADHAEVVARELRNRLGFGYDVRSWQMNNQALFSALELEKIAMSLILFLIVLVAAFNIVSTLVMVVADRTREIGILKAMGMTRADILRVFVLQGAWIGVIGTVVGTTAGLLGAWALGRFELIKIPPDVYFVDHLPVSIEWLDITRILLASIVVAFLATIYPALQASRLEPVDAIRHD